MKKTTKAGILFGVLICAFVGELGTGLGRSVFPAIEKTLLTYYRWTQEGFNILFVVSPVLVVIAAFFVCWIKMGKKFTFKNFLSNQRFIMVFVMSIFLSVGAAWYKENKWLPNKPLADDKFVIAIAKFTPIGDDARGRVDIFADDIKDGIKDERGNNNNGIEVKIIEEIPDCNDSENKDVRKKVEKIGLQNRANVVICGKIKSSDGVYSFEYDIIETKEKVVSEDVSQKPTDIFESKHSSKFVLEAALPLDDRNKRQLQNANDIGDFVRFLYGYANWSSGKRDIAKNIFTSLKNKDNYVNGCLSAVSSLYNNNQYEAAFPLLDIALAIDENNDESWIWLGIFYYNLGKYEESINAYKKSIELDSGNDYVYNNLGLAYYGVKNYDGALDAYSNALKLNSKYEYAYNNSGKVYNDLGKYKEAINAYKKSIELNPSSDSVWNNLGIVYDNSNNYNEAIKAYKEAIRLNPKYDAAYNNLGVVYNTLKDYDEAIKCYNKSIELNLENKYAYGNLGDIYNTLKNYDEAIAKYKKEVEFNAENDYFLNGLGDAYYNSGNYDDAIDAYNAALRLNPEYNAVWNDLGDAYYYGLENYDEARVAYARATELDKENDSYWNNLGNAYNSLENYKEASMAYEMAIKLNSKNNDAKKSLSIIQKNITD